MSHKIVPFYWIDCKKIRYGDVGWIHLFWAGPMAKSCEKGDTSSDSIKGREFFDCLRDFQPLKNGSLIIIIIATHQNQSISTRRYLLNDKYQGLVFLQLNLDGTNFILQPSLCQKKN